MVTGNQTDFDGGGISAAGSAKIIGNVIEDNVADSGGGVIISWTAVARDNAIRGNHTRSRHGGGVAVYGETLLVNNVISENTADVKGPGTASCDSCTTHPGR